MGAWSLWLAKPQRTRDYLVEIGPTSKRSAAEGSVLTPLATRMGPRTTGGDTMTQDPILRPFPLA